MTTIATTDLLEADAYDLIVIGAGAVGENVADRAVQGGLSVLIVEDELVGGEWLLLGLHALQGAPAARRACCGPRTRWAARGRRSQETWMLRCPGTPRYIHEPLG